MEILEINAQERGIKKGDAGRLLREGLVPAIIYGLKKTPSPVSVNNREILSYLHKGGESAVFQVNLKKEKINAIIREIKHDPVKDTITHIDFLRIDLNKPIATEVPVSVTGEAAGVKLGGVLEIRLHDIEIECLPMDIPRSIMVDVTELEIGDAIHVSDLKIDEKIKILTEPERTLVVVSAPTKEEEPVVAEEAEGEEGEGAEGEGAKGEGAKGEGAKGEGAKGEGAKGKDKEEKKEAPKAKDKK